MAITKVIDIELKDNSEKAIGSLKSQLRQAQNEVAALSDKYGATSKQAIEAAKRAGELNDKIGDAKMLTDAFNPDAKFNALSKSIGGVVSGFGAYQGALGIIGVESKNVEAQLLKVQSAMAISQSLQGLGEAKDSFKQLGAVAVDAFKGIRAAIGSTGIGLLVIALGTIYAYWDDIKEAVSGVSEEQKKVNSDLNETAKKQKDALSTLNAQDETLKRQGKTEKEILATKEKQTQEVINTQIKAIQSNAILRKQQEESTIRNKEMLTEMLKVLLLPINYTLKAIDLIGQAMGKNFDLVKKFNGGIANLVFDPDKVRAEGKKATEEEQKALTDLIAQRDGYHNQINAINEAQKQKEIDAEKDKNQKILDARKDYLNKAKEQRDEFNKLDDERLKRENDAQEKKKEDDVKRLEASAAGAKSLKAAKDKIAEEDRIRDEAVAQAKLDITKNTLTLVAEIAGKGSKIGKGVALAQATISGIEGVQSAYTTAQKSPITVGFPAYPYVQAGLAGAFSLLQIKKIMSTDPTGATSPNLGGAVGGGGASSPPSFNVVGNSGVNQLAQTLGKNEPAPIKAYVVANDVTTAQSLNNNIISNASLGG